MRKGEIKNIWSGNVYTQEIIFFRLLAGTHLLITYSCKSLWNFYYLIVLACTPTHPPVGGWGYMLKMFAPTPQPPPELKNVTKIFYTKYFLSKFFNKI